MRHLFHMSETTVIVGTGLAAIAAVAWCYHLAMSSSYPAHYRFTAQITTPTTK